MTSPRHGRRRSWLYRWLLEPEPVAAQLAPDRPRPITDVEIEYVADLLSRTGRMSRDGLREWLDTLPSARPRPWPIAPGVRTDMTPAEVLDLALDGPGRVRADRRPLPCLTPDCPTHGGAK